jgi:type IV pilus assembly protein PilW
MRARQRGLSLVEILVAVAIGMIGILIITQAYLTSENFNRSTLGEGGAQTNGLVALYLLERDARNAGYGFNSEAALGCGNVHWYLNGNYSASAGGALPNFRLAPVLIEGGTAAPDRITILYSSAAERMMPSTVRSNPADPFAVPLSGVEGFCPNTACPTQNDRIVIVSAGGCVLADVTQVEIVAQLLRMQAGENGPHNPPGWGFPVTYGQGDAVVNLGQPVLRTYLVADGKLQTIETLLATGTLTPVELVDGIVDLRALYGKDTDNDNVVDTWDLVTPTNGAGWLQVQAVRLAVLARIGTHEKPSPGASDCDATTVVPAWSGAATNPFRAISVAPGSDDRCYRYRVFETVVPLRSIIWRLP